MEADLFWNPLTDVVVIQLPCSVAHCRQCSWWWRWTERHPRKIHYYWNLSWLMQQLILSLINTHTYTFWESAFCSDETKAELSGGMDVTVEPSVLKTKSPQSNIVLLGGIMRRWAAASGTGNLVRMQDVRYWVVFRSTFNFCVLSKTQKLSLTQFDMREWALTPQEMVPPN